MELSTTQIYTQVSIRKLQAVHALTHPTAKLERRDPNGAKADAEHPALAKTTASADELFSHLAAEDDETAEGDDETAPSECGT